MFEVQPPFEVAPCSILALTRSQQWVYYIHKSVKILKEVVTERPIFFSLWINDARIDLDVPNADAISGKDVVS